MMFLSAGSYLLLLQVLEIDGGTESKYTDGDGIVMRPVLHLAGGDLKN